MRKLRLLLFTTLSVSGVVLSSALPAAAAPHTTGKTTGATCVLVADPQAGFADIYWSSLPKLSPGHAYLGDMIGPGPVNPAGFLFAPAGSTALSVVAYSVPGLYVVDLYLDNDKTGAGKGDGSGDKVTLLASSLCSAVLG